MSQPGSGSALEKALSPAARVVVDIYNRGLAVSSRPKNAVTSVMREIVAGIEEGKDIRETYSAIGRLIHNNEQRANVINQLLMTNDFRRATELTEARDQLEFELIQAAKRNDLTAEERLVLMKMLDEQLKMVSGRLAAGAQPVQDLIGLMQKINFAAQHDDRALQQRFAQTSPQGREIIRKLVTTMGRALHAAKATESPHMA